MIWNFLNTKLKNVNHKSVLVAIAKNEAPYFLEWIIYHKYIVGFDEIVIYDNDSTDFS